MFEYLPVLSKEDLSCLPGSMESFQQAATALQS